MKIKNNVLAVVISIMSCGLWSLPVSAGPGAAATAAACGFWCLFATVGYPACVAACIALAPLGCFSHNTIITVLENETEVKKNIADVVQGDLVKTIDNGKVTWTRVMRNIKTDGTFEFVRIIAQAQDGTSKVIEITPKHGVIYAPEAINTTTFDIASYTVVGDKMIDEAGNLLTVTNIINVSQQARYTLETAIGTVVASGFLVSTMCNEEHADGEKLLEPALKSWRSLHRELINNNVE
jgi:hypothetical protein